MKTLLSILLLLFSFASFAQTVPQQNNVSWYEFTRKLSVGQRFKPPTDTLSYPPGAINRDTTGLLAFAPNGNLYKLWNGVWALVGGAGSDVQILGDSAIVVDDDTLIIRPIQFETDLAPEYAFQDGDTIRLYPRQYAQDSLVVNQYTSREAKRAWIDTLRALSLRADSIYLNLMAPGQIPFIGVNGFLRGGSLYWDSTNNRIGAGLSNPSVPLHVLSPGIFSDIAYFEQPGSLVANIQVFRRNNNTNLSNGDRVGSISGGGYFNSTYNPSAQDFSDIQFHYLGNGTTRRGGIILRTQDGSGFFDRVTINDSGHVRLNDYGVNENTGTATTKPLFRSDGTFIEQLVDSAYNDVVIAGSYMGGALKAKTVGLEVADAQNGSALGDGAIVYVSFVVHKRDTINGAYFYIANTPSYTGDNYNGFAICRINGTNMEVLGSSTNDANFWAMTANTWTAKALSSPIVVDPGHYYLAYLYNASAAPTPPSILGKTLSTDQIHIGAPFGGKQLYYRRTGQTAIGTVALGVMSNITGVIPMIYVY